VDDPLARAVGKYAKGPLPDLSVRAAQVYLTFAGVDPGAIDGILGPKTRSALRNFRAARGLRQTEKPDDATLAALTPPFSGSTDVA
jgi:peptidoglycan hydrolase-like protein with peptidoglycan-binding domain